MNVVFAWINLELLSFSFASLLLSTPLSSFTSWWKCCLCSGPRLLMNPAHRSYSTKCCWTSPLKSAICSTPSTKCSGSSRIVKCGRLALCQTRSPRITSFRLSFIIESITWWVERRTWPRRCLGLSLEFHWVKFACLHRLRSWRYRILSWTAHRLWDRFPKDIKIAYHSVQVVNAIDGCGIFGDFLIEAVAEVVRGVGWNDQGFFTGLGLKSSETAAGGSFADTALATDEDPVESFLGEDVLECALETHFEKILKCV